MSAFMVSKEHIDALIAIIARGPKGYNPHRWGDFMMWSRIADLSSVTIDEQLNELGDLLVRENLSSILHRYPDTIADPDSTPGPREAYYLQLYRFQMPRRMPTIVEALKLISCYEYQSCEHPEWEVSVAHKVCSRLTHDLIGCLPGYEAAPWKWDEVAA